MQVITALLVGLGIGVLLGMLGGGGSIIAVPALIYLLDQSAYAATTASLIIVGFSSLTGALTHHRNNTVRWKQGLIFGAAGILGSFVGAAGASVVSEELLLSLFSGLLTVVSVMMFLRNARQMDDAARQPTHVGVAYVFKVVAVATAVGLLTGFFGVGGGFAIVPALTLVLGYSMPSAVGTSLVIITVNSLVSFLFRAGQDLAIDWVVVIPFSVTAALGTYLGSRFSADVSARTLSLLFATLIAVIALFIGANNIPHLL